MYRLISRRSFLRRGFASKNAQRRKGRAEDPKKMLLSSPPPESMSPEMERKIMSRLNFFQDKPKKNEKYNYVRMTGFHHYISVQDIADLFEPFGVRENDVVRQFQYQEGNGLKDLKASGLWLIRVPKEHFFQLFDHRNTVSSFTGLVNLLKVHEQDWNKANDMQRELFDGSDEKCVVVNNIPSAHSVGRQIRDFFYDFEILPGALRIHNKKSSTSASGFAIVPLASKEEAQRAILERHLKYFGSWRVSVTSPGHQIIARLHQNHYFQKFPFERI